MFIITRSIFCIVLVFPLSGCVSTIIDAAVDTTISVAKVPFKVAGAVIDVASGDDDENADDESEDK